MTTKKQHFVPRFYLGCFTDTEGKLRVCRRDAGVSFTAKPEGICAENYLYEVGHLGFGKGDSTPKSLRNYIENQLAGAESRLAPFYRQLIACCENREFDTDKFREARLAACILAANLIVRHPRILEGDRLGASELTKIFLNDNKLTERDQRMLEQIGVGDDFDMVSEIAIMQTLLLSDRPEVPFNRIYNAFASKRMAIVQAPVGMSFITTSMPLYFVGIDEDAYDFQVAYMPLSSKYAALFSSDEQVVRFDKASVEEVIQFNAAMLAYSDFWDTAMAQAEGPLELAVSRWKDARLSEAEGY